MPNSAATKPTASPKPLSRDDAHKLITVEEEIDDAHAMLYVLADALRYRALRLHLDSEARGADERGFFKTNVTDCRGTVETDANVTAVKRIADLLEARVTLGIVAERIRVACPAT